MYKDGTEILLALSISSDKMICAKVEVLDDCVLLLHLVCGL